MGGNRDLQFLKMFRDYLAVTGVRISDLSSKKCAGLQTKPPMFLDLRSGAVNGLVQGALWETDTAWLGELSMLSFGECPRDEEESLLWQILEGGKLEKYYLSETACLGVLRRAVNRGKALPEHLLIALMKGAGLFHLKEMEQDLPTEVRDILNDLLATLSTQLSNTRYVMTEGVSGGGRVTPTLTACPHNRKESPFVMMIVNGQIDQLVDIGVDESGKAQKVIAKGPGAVAYDLDSIILRRLTPTECARLQGMPDWWCDDVPHSDTAEYKMWGNGIALPCALYIMEGLAEIAAEKSSANGRSGENGH